MIRITKIIPKELVFDLLSDINIGKISMDSGKNKSIKNPKLIKTSIYLKMNFCDWVCMNKKIAYTVENHKFIDNNNKSFLQSLSNSFLVGYLRVRYISHLKEIEEIEKINLQIPKYIIKLIKKYK